MDLKTYLTPMAKDDREAFAKRCNTSLGHIQNVMYGLRACTTELAVAMEGGSAGNVDVETSCPDEKWVRVKDAAWPNRKGRPLLDHAASNEAAEKAGAV